MRRCGVYSPQLIHGDYEKYFQMDGNTINFEGKDSLRKSRASPNPLLLLPLPSFTFFLHRLQTLITLHYIIWPAFSNKLLLKREVTI